MDQDYRKKIEKVINEGEIKKFAYDGCHKIYLIESEEQEKEAKSYKYEILPIEELLNTYKDSCDLRFINFWGLNKESLVEQ